MLLAISVKEMSKFDNFCKNTQLFENFGQENAKIWQVLSRKCQIQSTFEGKISLAKGIIFTKSQKLV